MKLSLITTTCRPNPRLEAMAKTLAASLRIAPPGTELEWQVIDQTLERADDEAGMALRMERWGQIATPFAEMMDLVDDRGELARAGRVHIAHRAVRGGAFLGPAKLRNAALEVTTGDYVVFLDDCTVVTKNFLGTAAACAAEGRGWRCKAKSLHDVVIPEDGKLRHGDQHDRLRVVPYTTVGGACWGAPAAALREIGGFDPAYDGELKHNQLEAVLRLTRAGVVFVTTRRALAITLRRTRTELAGREAYVGTRNAAMFAALVADRSRVTVARGVAEAEAPGREAPRSPALDIGEDDTPVADVDPDPAPRAPADRADTAPISLPGLPPLARPPGVPVAPAAPADAEAGPPPPAPAGGGARDRQRAAQRKRRHDSRIAQAAVIAQQGKSVVTQDELDRFVNGEPLSPATVAGDDPDEFEDLDDGLGEFS